MRVTFLVKNFGTHGGTEEYLRAVGMALSERLHRVHFAYEQALPARGGQWLRFVESVRSSLVPNDPPARSAWLRDHLISEAPDILYVHSASFSSDLFAVARGRTVVVRFVHDFRPVCMRVSKVFPVSRQNCHRALGYGCLLHGCFIGPPRGSQKWPLSWNSIGRKIDERNTCRRLDRIVVASRFMKDLLIRNGVPADRISVIPLFCPSAVSFDPSKLPEPSRLLYVGQIQQFKGLALLLGALRELPASVTLDVAGDGAWRGHCERLVERWGLTKQVRFCGWVERERLSELYARASAVIVPSTWNEPFGLVGLEAMAHARPVIAFDVGGVQDWLVDGVTGVLAKKVGAEPLARAIQELCSDPDRASSMGKQGREQVNDLFTLEGHVNRLLEEFERLRPPAPILSR
jgi:glycosyltransferase involved in cell wall biosynthesis